MIGKISKTAARMLIASWYVQEADFTQEEAWSLSATHVGKDADDFDLWNGLIISIREDGVYLEEAPQVSEVDRMFMEKIDLDFSRWATGR